MKRKLYIAVLSIVLLFTLYTLLFNMSPGQVYESELIPFDKEGFTHATELNNTEKLVATNANYSLYIDETTSHFKVVDDTTDYVWKSNPTSMDPWELDFTKFITTNAINKQKATLELSYFNSTGSLATINNYDKSISHPESVLYDEGLRTYKIKYLENGFQVLYQLQEVDIDYLYFPKYIAPEVLESHPRREEMEGLAYNGIDEDLNMYEILQYEDMSDLVRDNLYEIFYGTGGLGYTRERAIAENAEFGYTKILDPLYFEIAVEVELTEHGVKTSIVQNSILESDSE